VKKKDSGIFLFNLIIFRWGIMARQVCVTCLSFHNQLVRNKPWTGSECSKNSYDCHVTRISISTKSTYNLTSLLWLFIDQTHFSVQVC
jgi:hypothetical protein